jgi:methyl-accepting chemotaxis protein
MTELAAVIAGVRDVASDSVLRAGEAAGLAQEQHAGLDALANTAQELARLAERLRESSSRFVVAAA